MDDKLKELEELRDYYYKAIMNLTNKQDIIDALPKPTYENFFEISALLLIKLYEDSNTCKEEVENNKNSEELELYQTFYELSKFKINILQELIDGATYQQQIESEYDKDNSNIENEETEANETKKKIIFAKKSSGRVYFEEDLKKFDKSRYIDILNLLKQIEDGQSENNVKKEKKLNSANKKLESIHEAIDYQIRICYRVLAKDVVYVMILRKKKANFDSIDREEIINRDSVLENQYNDYKQRFRNGDNIEELFEENDEILSRIKKNLGGNGFGTK